MPVPKQRPKAIKIEHPAKLPITEVKDEPLPRLRIAPPEIAHQQFPKRRIKAEVIPVAGLANSKDRLTMQTALNREVEGPALLREHRGRERDLGVDEEPVPVADCGGVRGVQVP